MVDRCRLADADLISRSMSGTADCEVRDEWFLEQDVNAWSSLVYVVAGVVLAAQTVHHRLPTAVYAFAAVVVAEGVGSVANHGSAGDLAKFLHDVAMIGALGFIAGWHAGRLVGATDRGSIVGLVAALVTASVLAAVAPGATNAMVAVAVVVIVATSLAARCRGLVGVWSPAVLVLGGVAVGMWGFGTPDSALCDTDSLLQPHAVWHVLTAVLALAWVDSAYAAVDPDHAPRMFRRFTDRTIGILASGLVLGFHRSIDVAWRERFPSDRPVLVVANHGNGIVDDQLGPPRVSLARLALSVSALLFGGSIVVAAALIHLPATLVRASIGDSQNWRRRPGDFRQRYRSCRVWRCVTAWSPSSGRRRSPRSCPGRATCRSVIRC